MVQGQWQPGIGDPTWIGWLTVTAYFLTALLCGVCCQRSRWRSGLWLIFCLVLMLLGINKQLDLQSWLTAFGRQVALENGWYQQRRQVQLDFIVVLGLTAIAVLVGLVRVLLVERQYRPTSGLSSGLALMGLGFLVCFVVIRAASFHHVDRLLRWQLGGLTMNGFLELMGIGLIAMGAMVNLRRLR
jgi:hypothetical protein